MYWLLLAFVLPASARFCPAAQQTTFLHARREHVKKLEQNLVKLFLTLFSVSTISDVWSNS